MLAYQNDTIAALATPPGRGGIAIVRVSGENARAYFRKRSFARRAGSRWNPIACFMGICMMLTARCWTSAWLC